MLKILSHESNWPCRKIEALRGADSKMTRAGLRETNYMQKKKKLFPAVTS